MYDRLCGTLACIPIHHHVICVCSVQIFYVSIILFLKVTTTMCSGLLMTSFHCKNLQSTLEQDMSPQKKGKSPTAKASGVSEENGSEKPSRTNNGSSELPSVEQGVAEGITEEEQVQQDPQMGPATLESLEAREDFKRQLEAIMDATKVTTAVNADFFLFLSKCYSKSLYQLFFLWVSFNYFCKHDFFLLNRDLNLNSVIINYLSSEIEEKVCERGKLILVKWQGS